MTPEQRAVLQAADGDALVAKLIALRDKQDQIKAETETALAPISQAMDMINTELSRRLEESGTKQMKFDSGTVSRVDTTSAICHDWEAFNAWVLREQRLDVFPRKLNSTPFKDMLEEETPLPPGIQMDTRAQVRVRRATSK